MLELFFVIIILLLFLKNKNTSIKVIPNNIENTKVKKFLLIILKKNQNKNKKHIEINNN